MPFDISWLIDKRVVYVRMYGNIDTEQVIQEMQATRSYRAEGIDPVHIIVDSRDVTKIPMSPDNLRQITTGTQRSDGWTIILTNSSVTRFLATLVTQTISLKYHFMDIPEAALAYLFQVEPELQQLDINESTLHY